MDRTGVENSIWPTILARTVLLDELASGVAEFIDRIDEGCQAAVAAQLRFHIICDRFDETSAETVVRDAVVSQWRGEVARLAADYGDPAQASLLDSLNPSIANGTSADPLSDTYDLLWRQAGAVYAPHWPTNPIVSLEWASQPLRQAADLYGITAQTNMNEREVTLTVHPQSFGPHAWATLPRIVMHELISHVGAHSDVKADQRSVFAEGFMDWVSIHYLSSWAGLLNGLGAAVITQAHRSAEVLAPSSSKYGHVRRTGHRHAEELVDRVTQSRGLDRWGANALIAALGVKLNSEPGSLVQKDNVLHEWVKGEPGNLVGAIDALVGSGDSA